MKTYNTDARRWTILKRLNELSPEILSENTKLQKAVFFYEMFQMLDGKDYSLKYLKAYKNGPVFSDLYGDIKYNNDFQNYIKTAQGDNQFKKDINLNESHLRKALFIVKTATAKEVSAITHKLDLGSNQYKDSYTQTPITESNITEKDKQLLSIIKKSTPEFSNDLGIEKIEDKYFIIDKKLNFSDKDWEKIEKLANFKELVNPVYVLGIDEDGRLIID